MKIIKHSFKKERQPMEQGKSAQIKTFQNLKNVNYNINTMPVTRHVIKHKLLITKLSLALRHQYQST